MVTLTKEKIAFEVVRLEEEYAENGNEIHRISTLSHKIKEERTGISKGKESIMISICSMIVPCTEITAPTKLFGNIGDCVCDCICQKLDDYVSALIKKNNDIMTKILNYKKTLEKK